MWLPALGLFAGVLFGLIFSVSIPAEYARYTAIAILAALDSILGATRAELEGDYDTTLFISGLLSNMFLAGLLTYVGDRLGVQLNLAAVVGFGVRVFGNLAQIRRLLVFRFRRVRPEPSRETS